MKYVSFLFAVALLAGVANASEKAVSFHYNNNNAYYACSYAEAQMSKTLIAVGADNVVVDCSGGINDNQLWPVSVDATFTHVEKGARTVTLRGKESCDFNVKMINAVLATIDHKLVKSQASCWDADGNYSFEITLK